MLFYTNFEKTIASFILEQKIVFIALLNTQPNFDCTGLGLSWRFHAHFHPSHGLQRVLGEGGNAGAWFTRDSGQTRSAFLEAQALWLQGVRTVPCGKSLLSTAAAYTP